MILSKLYSPSKPPKDFNLLFLDHKETLISSVECKLRLDQVEKGKLHLTSRALYFQPEDFKLPVLKFKFSDPEFQFSYNFLNHSDRKQSNTYSPLKKHQRNPEEIPLLIINTSILYLIKRQSISPIASDRNQEAFVFETNREEIFRLSKTLEMVTHYEEEEVLEVLYGVRYKELLNVLQSDEESQSSEFLLHYPARRLMIEGVQLGSFILTRASFRFYPLLNLIPNGPLNYTFREIVLATRYRYLHMDIGLCIYFFEGPPIIILFENNEQMENIYSFLQNKIKFAEPISELEEITDKWTKGVISNFDYLVFLNHLSSRSCLNLSQYPVFPWVIANYSCSSKT